LIDQVPTIQISCCQYLSLSCANIHVVLISLCRHSPVQQFAVGFGAIPGGAWTNFHRRSRTGIPARSLKGEQMKPDFFNFLPLMATGRVLVEAPAGWEGPKKFEHRLHHHSYLHMHQ
jgi:hypothetical protein